MDSKGQARQQQRKPQASHWLRKTSERRSVSANKRAMSEHDMHAWGGVNLILQKDERVTRKRCPRQRASSDSHWQHVLFN